MQKDVKVGVLPKKGPRPFVLLQPPLLPSWLPLSCCPGTLYRSSFSPSRCCPSCKACHAASAAANPPPQSCRRAVSATVIDVVPHQWSTSKEIGRSVSDKRGFKCISYQASFAKAYAVVRSVMDLIYILNMLLQFRLAYVSLEFRVVGTGDFVIEPKKIALHYLRGYLVLNIFVMVPLAEVRGFDIMDEQVLDAIRGRLRQTLYIAGSYI